MTVTKILVGLVLVISVTTTLAQATERFINEDPFAPIAGRWTSKEAQFVSSTTNTDYADWITKWKGTIYGVIKPNGYVVMKAENNCILTGFVAPFTASTVMWTFSGQLEGCSVGHLNQQLVGNFRKEKRTITIDLRERPFLVGKPPIAYSLKAQVSPY